jgi:hypothetical protein
MYKITSGVIIPYTEDVWITYGDVGSQGKFHFFELEKESDNE